MNNNLKSTKTLNILSMIYLALYLIVFYFFRYMNESILSLLVQIVLLGLIVIKRNKYAQWIFHINSLPIFLDLIGIKDSVSNTFNIIAMISLVCMIVILNIYLIKTGDSCKFLKSRWNDRQIWLWYDISMIILITIIFSLLRMLDMGGWSSFILLLFILTIVFNANRVISTIYCVVAIIMVLVNVKFIISILIEIIDTDIIMEIVYLSMCIVMVLSIQVILFIVTSGILIFYNYELKKNLE